MKTTFFCRIDLGDRVVARSSASSFLMRMLRNWTFIGGPACSCSARIPDCASLLLFVVGALGRHDAIDLVDEVESVGRDRIVVPVFLLDF